MIGDGYTVINRCEHAENYEWLAPDAGPFYCEYEENPVTKVDRCYHCGKAVDNPECNPLSHVELWLSTGDSDDVPVGDIERVADQARQSDKLARQFYQVAAFMFNDACNAMDKGLDQTYRTLSVDKVFSRIEQVFDVPIPMDMSTTDVPESPELEEASRIITLQ